MTETPQENFQINDGLAADALCRLALVRGLFTSRLEAEQAWDKVHESSSPEQRLCAAWSWLFPGHSIERMPLALAQTSQLPAWVLQGNCVGIVSALAAEGQPMKIDWLGAAPEQIGEAIELWIPLSPGLTQDEAVVTPRRRGPATEAIVAAMRDHKPLFVRVGVASLFMNVLAVVSSLFAMQVYDRVIPNFAYATLWILASGVVLALGFEVVFKLVRLKLLEASALRLDEALSLYFFEKLLALKLDRRPNRIGSLVAQVKDYETIKNFFTSSTLFLLADLPFVLFFVVVVGMIGGPLAWVLLGFLVVGVGIGLVVHKPIAKLQREENDEAMRRTGVLFEAVAGAETIKAQAGEPRFSDVWLRSVRASGELGTGLRQVNAYAHFALQACQQLATIAIMIVGVYLIQSGGLTVGGLIACSILGGRALASIAQVTNLMLQWHSASYALEILNKILSMQSDDAPERQAHTRSASLDYSFKDVHYAYAGSRTPQFAAQALNVKAGERITILGSNGSGKTTLLKLFAGIATPNAGEVRLGGLDLQRCRPTWLTETIGYLPQEVRLFSGTLAENLSLGLSIPDEAALRAAAEKTGLIATIDRHPLGLNLPIREGGSGLSGGQRQLVGLTRLVLQQPKIWLLDEPSASLDKDSEDRLVQIIKNLPADITVIFTSHKPAWTALAQRIWLVQDGVLKADAPADKVRLYAANSAEGKAALAQQQNQNKIAPPEAAPEVKTA